MDKFLQIIIVLFAVLNSPDSSATQKAEAIEQARVQVNQIQMTDQIEQKAQAPVDPTLQQVDLNAVPVDQGISTGISTSTPQMPPAPQPMRPGQRPSVSA